MERRRGMRERGRKELALQRQVLGMFQLCNSAMLTGGEEEAKREKLLLARRILHQFL